MYLNSIARKSVSKVTPSFSSFSSRSLTTLKYPQYSSFIPRASPLFPSAIITKPNYLTYPSFPTYSFHTRNFGSHSSKGEKEEKEESFSSNDFIPKDGSFPQLTLSKNLFILALEFLGILFLTTTFADWFMTVQSFKDRKKFLEIGLEQSFLILENRSPQVLEHISPLRLTPGNIHFEGYETREYMSILSHEVEPQSVPIKSFRTPFPFRIFNVERDFILTYFLYENSIENGECKKSNIPSAVVKAYLFADSYGRPRVGCIFIQGEKDENPNHVFEISGKSFKKNNPPLKKIVPKSSLDYPANRKTIGAPLSSNLEQLKQQLDKLLIVEPDTYMREKKLYGLSLFKRSTKFEFQRATQCPN